MSNEITDWRAEARKWEKRAKQRQQHSANDAEISTLQEAIRNQDHRAAQAIIDRAIRNRLTRKAPRDRSLDEVNDKLDRVLELLDPNYERSQNHG